MKQFIHLRCHTNYSVGEGLLNISRLLDSCIEHNFPAIAVTDTGNMFGVREFSNKMISKGVQPIIGFQILVEYENFQGNFVLLAKDLNGYKNLLKLHKHAYKNKVSQKLDFPTISFQELLEHISNLVVLTGGIDGVLARILQANAKDKAELMLDLLVQRIGSDLYIELNRFFTPEDRELEDSFLKLALKKQIPIVATNNVTFLEKEDFEVADILLCIGQGVQQKEDRRKKALEHSYLKSSEEMIELFKDLPEAIENTVNIAQKCCFFINKQPLSLPQFSNNEEEFIIQEANAGLQQRLQSEVYPHIEESKKDETAKYYQERLDFELSIINNMGFCGYFLIVSDFIKWAKSHDIPVGPGRGSGAGSLVAWCLLITDVNPIKFNLIFERFLNPERISMPDFDIDFCHDHRDEVIDYVKDRYGIDKVAHIITFGTLQAKAAIKDVGRTMGLRYSEVDQLTKKIPYSPPSVPLNLAKILKENAPLQQEMKEKEHINKLFQVALKLEGMYRNISTHAAGVVISKQPLDEVVPLFYDSEDGIGSVGFSMKYIEDVGLVKFDFLALKALTIIKDALKTVEESETITIDLLNISYEDSKILELFIKGETLGVFQLESRGMTDVTKQLKPDHFEDIIAIIALYRPGPMDNIPLYLNNKKAKKIECLHPKMEDILRETYGIMIYQEQVMQVAQVIAGYTLGGADILRRAMGKKDPVEMQKQRVIFIAGAKQHNDIEANLAGQIFDLIEKFAGYGFNKSHAVAYALISWQAAYLKAYYPTEFLASSMSADMRSNNKSSERFLEFIEEAKHYNIKLLTPSVNCPAVKFAIELDENGNKAIRYSLLALKGVGEPLVHALVNSVSKNGKFTSIENFLERIEPKYINKKQLEALIKSGAFDSVYTNRNTLFQNIEAMISFNNNVFEDKTSNQINLFDVQENKNLLTLVPYEDWDTVTKSENELEIANYFLSSHPLSEFNDILIAQKVDSYKSILNSKKNKAFTAGYLMKISSSKSKSGNLFANLTFYDHSSIFTISLFGKAYEKYIGQIKEHKCYVVKTVTKRDENDTRLFIDSIEELTENYKIKNLGRYKQEEGANLNNTKTNTAINNLANVNQADPNVTNIELILEEIKYLDYLKNIHIPTGNTNLHLYVKHDNNYLKYFIENIELPANIIQELSQKQGIVIKVL
ncbi:DNA polymerase III subunit alpha [Candidatus Hepatincola sp. Pdp]